MSVVRFGVDEVNAFDPMEVEAQNLMNEFRNCLQTDSIVLNYNALPANYDDLQYLDGHTQLWCVKEDKFFVMDFCIGIRNPPIDTCHRSADRYNFGVHFQLWSTLQAPMFLPFLRNSNLDGQNLYRLPPVDASGVFNRQTNSFTDVQAAQALMMEAFETNVEALRQHGWFGGIRKKRFL